MCVLHLGNMNSNIMLEQDANASISAVRGGRAGSGDNNSGMQAGSAMGASTGEDSSGIPAHFLGMERYRSAGPVNAVPSDADSALRKLAMERYLRR